VTVTRPGRLAGKTAFVTAAGAGIGQATALAFAAEEARVIATDLNGEALKALDGVKGISTATLDVTDAAAVKAAAAAAGDQQALAKAQARSVQSGALRDAGALRAAGIDPGVRGETLAVGDFVRLANALAAVAGDATGRHA